jgi:hypothetical protein
MSDFEITSHGIISECFKAHGKAELFPRNDGLQFEERRAQVRREYLESHPSTAHHQAIVKAAVTRGMTRAEVIAAWGLIEEDTRMAFGNVTEERGRAFAYFTGIEVGTPYALYFKDDILVGVRQFEELVPPHARELDMRFAEQGNLFYFYDGSDGQLRGSNVDQFNMDWDTAHHRLYSIDIVPDASAAKIESQLRTKGVWPEYERILNERGYQPNTVPAEVRALVALSLLPYPSLAHVDAGEFPVADAGKVLPAADMQIPDEPPLIIPGAPMREPPASAADSNARSLVDDVPPLMPSVEWFEYVADGRQHQAAFPAIGGKVELVQVQWWEGLLFRVTQVPLLVNGVSEDDIVEVEWQEGEIIPHFKRVVDNEGHRTVRVTAVGTYRKEWMAQLLEHVQRTYYSYRYENKVVVFTIGRPELPEEIRDWLSYIDASWIYTDTLTQT